MAYVILSVNRYLATGLNNATDPSLLVPDAILKTQRFHLIKRLRFSSATDSSNQTRVASSITLTITRLLPAATITSATTARRNTRRHTHVIFNDFQNSPDASYSTIDPSLLIADVTADFIIADPALALLFTTADCDDTTADVIIADSRSCASSQLLILDFFQSAILTSSLLLAASSSRHADIIIDESRFLFASIQQLISSFFALLIPDLYCSSSSSTYLQQTS
ncbi:hypothetical protein F511_09065 [Dorcoceras hygrometricum]|uniref:Uncharacterized protein n=1 Tax=Dorcoceras hygrometricum TaxID=472368 RepID=A0A2Z7DG82_9LAMI|nr:hypothetical protein F511_09065 [Dorcoceras hygrometricum]